MNQRIIVVGSLIVAILAAIGLNNGNSSYAIGFFIGTVIAVFAMVFIGINVCWLVARLFNRIMLKLDDKQPTATFGVAPVYNDQPKQSLGNQVPQTSPNIDWDNNRPSIENTNKNNSFFATVGNKFRNTVAWIFGMGLVIFVVKVLTYAIGFTVGHVAGATIVSAVNESNIDSLMIQQAATMNKSLPRMIDSETRFDSVAGTNHEFSYYYTMVNYAKADLDQNKVNAFIVDQRMKLTVNYCTGMKSFADNKVPVQYVYSDKNGLNLLSIEVQPSDCATNTTNQ
jgi:Na+-transporting methylmalonyl-CoA/oxaloacetate decarboxylase gamma subunit